MQASSPAPAMQQWLGTKVTLRRELRFDFRSIASENQVVIEDPIRAKFFQIGLPEFKLISSFDGQRTLAEVLENWPEPTLALTSISERAADGKEHPLKSEANARSLTELERLSAEQAVCVVQWVLQNNLGYAALADNSQRLEAQAEQARRAKLVGIFNPLSIKLPLLNPNQLLGALQGFASLLFSGGFLLVWLVVGGYAASILAADWQKIGLSSMQVFAGYRWLWLLLAWVGLKMIHELAHGLACKKFGGEVPEAGVLFILFTPMAYVNVTSMWRLANRWHRMLISSAGIYVELFLSFVALIVWRHVPGLWSDIGFNIFMMASINTILFNANPLMRFDGYFVLSDLLQIPNLYPKSMRWLGDRCKHVLWGSPLAVGALKPGESWAVPTYGVLAWCWKMLIGVSLLIAASVLFHGAGIVLTGVGIVLWYALPAWKQWNWFWNAQRKQQIRWANAISSLTLASLLIWGLFVVFAAPATKSAPALVQFSGEQILRADSEGFIKEVLVQTGQPVVKGQSLLVLESPELELRTLELAKQIEEGKISSRIKTRNQELALAQAETERVESLKTQLKEQNIQRESLIIRAPADGMVFRRGLADQVGRYVVPGEELLTFAQTSLKQVTVSVDQRDWDSIKSCEGKKIQLMFSGHALSAGKIRRIIPQASLEPMHPSLTATHGGPLAVRPKSRPEADSSHSKKSFELLAPRFSIELELDSDVGQSLSAGQRGYAFFDAKRQSMASYLYLAMTDWFTEKLELAAQGMN